MKVKKLKKIDKNSGEKTHGLNVGVACVLGFPAGLLYNNIEHWIEQNSAKNINKYKGLYWTYNSISAYMASLPELSREQIRGGLRKLEESGLIQTTVNNKNMYDKTKWYTLTQKTPRDLLIEDGYELVDTQKESLNEEDEEVCLNTQGVLSITQGVCSTPNQYHYKPIINSLEDSFNKLKDEDKSSLEDSLENIKEETPIINKNRVIPTEDYKSLQSLLNKWKEKPLGAVFAGSAHKLAPDGQEQSNTILQIYKGYKACLEDILTYYDKNEKEFYPLWVSAHGINREAIVKALETHSSKELLAKALRKHLDMLASGSLDENNWKLSKGLHDFFMQRRTGRGKEAKTSWLIYWICNPEGYAPPVKQPVKTFLDPEHPHHNYKGMYGRFEKVFPNDNIIPLTEAYVNVFATAKNYRDKGMIKLIEIFTQYLKPLIESDQGWMDSCTPKRYLPGSTQWKVFISKVKEGNMYTRMELEKYEKDHNINISEQQNGTSL